MTDCVMAPLEVPSSAAGDAMTASGSCVRSRSFVTVFVGFANPETSESSLNCACCESDRSSLRPAFGYSQDVLKHTLRPEIVSVTRTMLAVLRDAPARREYDSGSSQLPPAFLLSACARAFLALQLDTLDATSGVEAADDVMGPAAVSEEALRRRLCNELLEMSDGSPLLRNYFLPIERFEGLDGVTAWLEMPRGVRAATLRCGKSR
jgi:hypothetical protein